MQLIIFHYHLLPGGVTDVIENSLKAVVPGMQNTTVRLVCGSEDNTASVIARLRDSGVDAEAHIVPDLGYTSPDESPEDARARVERLHAQLLERYGSDDCLWWVHNFHVGKNPAFTLALCRIAESHRAPKMLFHIHDFPECARYENLAYLNRIAGESPYPAGPSVHYAVINARDRDALVASGMDPRSVHLLVNPLPGEPESKGKRISRGDLTTGLLAYAQKTGQVFNPSRPVILYPVRTIRRKNVLEMAAIARLAGDMNLLVTLPGISEMEKPYSELVSEAYATGAARGGFGMGRQEDEYGLTFTGLTHSADAVVSSSVQEGFGLLFVNALRWSVPLFARDLPVLDGIRSLFSGYPAAFYSRFSVPFSTPGVSSIRAYLRMRYRERLDQLNSVIPAEANAKLNHQLDQVLAGAVVDFAYLPPDLQFPFLRGLEDEGFSREVLDLNRDVVGSLATIVSATCPDSHAVVEETFGFGSFSSSFQAILGSYGSGRAAVRNLEVQKRLVQRFAELENLRLLFAPMGHHHG